MKQDDHGCGVKFVMRMLAGDVEVTGKTARSAGNYLRSPGLAIHTTAKIS